MTRLSIAALVLLIGATLSGCGAVRQAERIRTLEANDLLDRYYETVWNRENNQPGERREARRELRMYVKAVRGQSR